MIIGFVVVAILTLAAMFLAVLWHRKREKRRKEGINAISSVFGADPRWNNFEGTYGNFKYSCTFDNGEVGRPSFMVFALYVQLPFGMRVIKERPVHRLSRNIGLSVEIKTGDQGFDRNYYVDSDNPDDARIFLSDFNNRTTVNEIFNILPEVTSIAFSNRGISVEIRPFHPDEVQPEDLKALLPLVTRLTEFVGKTTLVNIEPAKVRRAQIKAVVIAAFVAMGIVDALFFLFIGVTDYATLENQIYYDAFCYSLLPVGVLTVASYFLIRGKSNSHARLAVILVLSFLVFPLAVKEIMLFVNGRYDTAQAKEHIVPVMEKNYNRRTGCVVYVPSWTKSGEQNRISVNKSFYLGLKKGELINVETKPGYYGYEWISNVSDYKAE